MMNYVDCSFPWFDDMDNYIVAQVIPSDTTYQQKKKNFADVKYYYWEDPFLFRICAHQIIKICVFGEECVKIWTIVIRDPLKAI